MQTCLPNVGVPGRAGPPRIHQQTMSARPPLLRRAALLGRLAAAPRRRALATSLEDENARILGLLEKEMLKTNELNHELDATRVKLAETEQVTAEKYHNMFLQNEWTKFSDAYEALLQRVAKLERQKEDAIANLEAIRGRLRESKHLPHLGVQWVLWGKGNKAAAVHPSATPSSTLVIQETAKATRVPPTHRGPPPLPGKGGKAGNKATPQPLALASNTSSAPSLQVRPKR